MTGSSAGAAAIAFLFIYLDNFSNHSMSPSVLPCIAGANLFDRKSIAGQGAKVCCYYNKTAKPLCLFCDCVRVGLLHSFIVKMRVNDAFPSVFGSRTAGSLIVPDQGETGD